MNKVKKEARAWLRRLKAILKPKKNGGKSPNPSLAVTPYTTGELDCIYNFVCAGGGLLLMTNHGDLLPFAPYNMTQYDAILACRFLACRFGVEIENTLFTNPEPVKNLR